MSLNDVEDKSISDFGRDVDDVDDDVDDVDVVTDGPWTAELSGAILEHCQAVASRTYRILISIKHPAHPVHGVNIRHVAAGYNYRSGHVMMTPVPKVHVRGPLRKDSYG